MIGRLRGVIADRLADGSVIVDVAGVGYEVFVPLGARLPDPPEPVTLHVHTHVREDALVLYGFPHADDRAAFRTLLGVSSIGPKLAMAICGALDAQELAAAIASQDPSRFKGIPGVGKKIVERLLLELKDKLGFAVFGAAAPAMPKKILPKVPVSDAPLGQVASALVAMGFKPTEAEKAIAAIADTASGKPTDALLREALAHLS